MSWAAVVVSAVGAGTAIYQNQQAKNRERRAQSALDDLSKEKLPEYTQTPEMSSYYSRILNNTVNPRGISAADKANAQRGATDAINTTLYNIRGQSGGNTSRFLAGALTPALLNANTNVALADARMKNENYNRSLSMLGGLVSGVQNLGNMNTTAAMNRRLMTEQALGGSILQNQAYRTQAANNFASDAMGAGAISLASRSFNTPSNTSGGYRVNEPYAAGPMSSMRPDSAWAGSYTTMPNDYSWSGSPSGNPNAFNWDSGWGNTLYGSRIGTGSPVDLRRRN